MYQITDTERGVIGYCDEPRYIKIKPSSGAYIPVTEAEAEGIAFLGTPYNLHNKPPIKEGLRTVIVNEKDGGEIMLGEIKDMEGRTGDVLCDMDADIEDIKEALCEIDEILEGGMQNE